jgi:hypothetical protein
MDAGLLEVERGGVLEVGSAQAPLPAGRSALIRLTYFAGMDKDTLPAMVCSGGRMDLHGAALSRTWVKLGATAGAGDGTVLLAEPVQGWRVGDRVLITATRRQSKQHRTYKLSTRDNTQSEERTITAILGRKVSLDLPLRFPHLGEGEFRGEVANLSRNVVVESAGMVRGHTMYHRGSAGSIGHAEFRGLGKRGVLGKYALHFHQVRGSMRGSSVVGASIWNSENRWITVHGSDHLEVRDCVGYNSIGHGYFLEDGTEAHNAFHGNLAVQARGGPVLPGQVIPFDHNEGAGFWWANCLNSFTGNVACECDEYGFRFDAAKTPDFDPVLPVEGTDGTVKQVDVRTLPFLRFEGNEAHCQRRFAVNLGGMRAPAGGGVDGTGPEELVVREMKVWDVHWGFHTRAPRVFLDGFTIRDADYGFWRNQGDGIRYQKLRLEQVAEAGIPDPKGAGGRGF